MVIVVVVGAFSTCRDGRAAGIIRIPVHRTGLIGKIDILENCTAHHSRESSLILQTPQAVEAVEEADTRAVLPRLLHVGADGGAIAEPVAEMHIPRSQGAA